MARKSSGSGGGYLFLLLIGGALYLANAAYEFFLKNQAAVIAIGAIALVGWLVFKFGRAKPAPTPDPGATAHVEPAAIRTFGVPNKNSGTSEARWIGPGETVQIGDLKIDAGMFYFGESVSLPGRGASSQYVLNPKLPARAAQPDVPGKSMPYWPSYASITPAARRAFLEWIAAGRLGPDYGIGYVFLFFYGLEHRVFVDKPPGAAQIVVPEVERLLSIYGGNRSFKAYASNFLVHARLAAGLAPEPPRLSPERINPTEIAPAVRFHIGSKLADSNVLGAEDALLWTLNLPDTYLRTPGVRCFDELVALWKIRFGEKYPGGFRIAVPKQKLKFSYRASSGAFQVDVPGPHATYPDITALRKSPDELKGLLQACSEELESFSRFVGRHPDQKSSIEAALLLPPVLQSCADNVVLDRAAREVFAIMGGRNTATAKLQNVLDAAGFDRASNGKVPQALCDRLGQMLDRIDVAIEPDRRYGSGPPQPDDQVVIFRSEKGGPIDASKPAYQAMKAQVEVSALAASADGSPTADELQAIIAAIKAAPDLTKVEGLRLIAYSITIFKSAPKQQRILRRLSQLSDPERRAIAGAAKSIVVKSGGLKADHVKFFERLQRTLNLPREEVYFDLHRAAAGADEPIVVSTENRVSGIAIPPEAVPGVRIDVNRLATVRKQTQEVSTLLSQIFVDDSAGTASPGDAVANGSPLKGLDNSHAELVDYLEMKGEIPRQEFEERAKSLKLLPDGAIETINEWSLDHFDEPLLEDGEHVVFAAALRDRLTEMRTGER